ncbi:MAG: hypothetical protein LBB65_00780 [Burkholderiales bacterium]|jgi:oligoribonuclease (3'-5' exoribonuclease)|nr:hypothetical protein [Burkholderiales bacterium]
MSLINAKDVSIECPKCKKKHTKAIGDLKENPVIGNVINVDIRYLTKEMTKIDKALGRQRKEFERSAE